MPLYVDCNGVKMYSDFKYVPNNIRCMIVESALPKLKIAGSINYRGYVNFGLVYEHGRYHITDDSGYRIFSKNMTRYVDGLCFDIESLIDGYSNMDTRGDIVLILTDVYRRFCEMDNFMENMDTNASNTMARILGFTSNLKRAD